ncbi:MAG: histidine kinase [Oscillospiraceae bacterium]|nr:histidine kinase [Oscillospiraceae bacterium]
MMVSVRYFLFLAPLLLELAGLCFAVWIDPYVGRKHRRVMFLIIALSACLVAQNVVNYLLEQGGIGGFPRTLNSVVGYSIRPVILVLFFYVVSERKPHWHLWLLIGINWAVFMTAFFSHLSIWYDEYAVFRGGPLHYTCHIISAVLLCELVYLTVREYGHDRKGEIWLPLINALLIVASVIMDSFVDYRSMPISYLTVAICGCTVVYYIWLHLQFVRRHEQAMMAEQRIQIMMTQIQPHFLYNTLSTIQALCALNPQKAAEITGKFSFYLRQNLNTLEYPGMIPFEKELEHTKIYADIEMVRFPNIRVLYEIEDAGFLIPPLTVQPIVENAIRHGVRVREQGLVTVTAQAVKGGHQIVIRDNGIGFDVKQLAHNDGSHIGLRNVQERIETMCGGSMTVSSRIGEGTTVTIHIPERGEETAR